MRQGRREGITCTHGVRDLYWKAIVLDGFAFADYKAPSRSARYADQLQIPVIKQPPRELL